MAQKVHSAWPHFQKSGFIPNQDVHELLFAPIYSFKVFKAFLEMVSSNVLIPLWFKTSRDHTAFQSFKKPDSIRNPNETWLTVCER